MDVLVGVLLAFLLADVLLLPRLLLCLLALVLLVLLGRRLFLFFLVGLGLLVLLLSLYRGLQVVDRCLRGYAWTLQVRE
jgi:hypothetical protein